MNAGPQTNRPQLTLKQKAQVALGMAAYCGMWLLKKTVGLVMGIAGFLFSSLKQQPSGSSSMNLRSIFLGAALMTTALAGPGLYYMTQSNDIVRTRVTGKEMADVKAEFPGQKYFIYTRQGKFDTYGVQGGGVIKEGCVYDFNLKSARLQLWPPGFTRSIVSYRPAPGGCEGPGQP